MTGGDLAALLHLRDPITITIPGRPHPKGRPRFSHGHAHTTAADRAAETHTAWHLRAAIRQPLTGALGVACLFTIPDHRHGDTDNLLKHVLDAGNHVAWHDDRQITALLAFTRIDATAPGTLVVVGARG